MWCQASLGRSFLCFRAQLRGVKAQGWWPTGLVAPGHVKSSRTKDRTCIPCIGRWILNHRPTQEALPPKILPPFSTICYLSEGAFWVRGPSPHLRAWSSWELAAKSSGVVPVGTFWEVQPGPQERAKARAWLGRWPQSCSPGMRASAQAGRVTA